MSDFTAKSKTIEAMFEELRYLDSLDVEEINKIRANFGLKPENLDEGKNSADCVQIKQEIPESADNADIEFKSKKLIIL